MNTVVSQGIRCKLENFMPTCFLKSSNDNKQSEEEQALKAEDISKITVTALIDACRERHVSVKEKRDLQQHYPTVLNLPRKYFP